MIDSRLITFLMLVQTKSYTKTAQALFITQPAVTHHIKTLEKDNNVKLFANTKTFRLSIAGQIIYNYAKKCELMYQQLKQALKNDENPKHVMRLAVTKQVSSVLMDKVLVKWLKLHPKDKISMSINSVTEIAAKIHAGEVDYAIVDHPYDQTVFNGMTLLNFSANFYIGSTHSLAHKQRISIDALKKETIISDCSGTGIRTLLDGVLKKHNVSVNSLSNLLEINDPITQKNMAVEGIGIVYLYDDFVKEEVKDKKLLKIVVDNQVQNQQFNAICSIDSLMEKQFQTSIKEIVDIYQGLEGK